MKIAKAFCHDLRELLPPMIFFFLAFTMILITKQLVLLESGISWSGLGSALVGAFLVGKVVLLVDKLPLANKLPGQQLFHKAFWKWLIYLLAAELVQYLEHILHLLKAHHSFREANALFLNETIWPHFWLIQIWLALLFLIYCALRELVRAIGQEKVIQMFFGNRAPEI